MEFALLRGIQELHNPWLDQVMQAITWLGNGGWFWCAQADGTFHAGIFGPWSPDRSGDLKTPDRKGETLLDRPFRPAFDSGSPGLLLPFRTYFIQLCGRCDHIVKPEKGKGSCSGTGSSGTCGADWIFQNVPLCAFPHGRPGGRSSGHRFSPGSKPDLAENGEMGKISLASLRFSCIVKGKPYTTA